MPIVKCPNGHRFRIPKVVYGYPTPEAMEAAGRGELTLGGCMPDLPVERDCPRCGATTVWWSERWSGGPNTGQPEAPEALN